MTRALLAFALGLALSLYTTPLMRRAALQFGIVDRPDGALKTQSEPVAYLGGLAVFLAFLITLGVTFEFGPVVLGILLAGTLVLLVGLIDDLGVLSPWEKLVGQSLAIAVLLKSGVYVKLIFLPWTIDLSISILWLLTITNALNIIDVMDGLASGVAAIAALFLAAAAILNDEPMVAVMASALAGSLVGFLRYNSTPARIYLGDAGSLFVGLTLAALAMNGGYTRSNWAAMMTPVVIFGVPLFDLAFVAVVRWRRGLSPFRGSPDHFALRLRRAGFSVRQVVGMTYATGLALGLAGFSLMAAASERVGAVVLLLLSTSVAATATVLRKTGA